MTKPEDTGTLEGLIRAVKRTNKSLGQWLTEFSTNNRMGPPLRSNLSEKAYQSLYIQYIAIRVVPARVMRLFAAACGNHVCQFFPDGGDRCRQATEILRVIRECAEATQGRRQRVEAVRSAIPEVQRLYRELEPEVDDAVDAWTLEAFTKDGIRRSASIATVRRRDLLTQELLSLDVIFHAANAQILPPRKAIGSVERMIDEHFEAEACTANRSRRRATTAWQVKTLRQLVEAAS